MKTVYHGIDLIKVSSILAMTAFGGYCRKQTVAAISQMITVVGDKVDAFVDDDRDAIIGERLT